MAVRQFVKFVIENECFGVEIIKVKEINKPQEIFKIPNTPQYMEGLLNLRGIVLTVYNLRKRFGMPNKAFDENTRIMFIYVNELLIGFVVDEVNEIVRVDDNNIEAAPSTVSTIDNEFVSGIAKIDEKLLLLLDLSKILSASEEAKIKGIVEQHSDKL